jgi:hypothetical protein
VWSPLSLVLASLDTRSVKAVDMEVHETLESFANFRSRKWRCKILDLAVMA